MTFDPKATLIAQYANSPTILQLIDNLWQQIDKSADFDTFVAYVWDISTAQGFGLDILGRIIGQSRQINNVPAIWPVTVAPGTISLTDDQYRRMLLIKAMANISNASIASMNKEMMMMSNGRGNAFVRNLGDMHIQYVFHLAPMAYEYAIIRAADTVTCPAGVGFDVTFSINPYFGFSEAQSWDTFDRAIFAAY